MRSSSTQTLAHLGEDGTKAGDDEEADLYYNILANVTLGFGQLMSLTELKEACKRLGDDGANILQTLIRLMVPDVFMVGMDDRYSARYEALVELLPLVIGARRQEQKHNQRVIRKRLGSIYAEIVARKNDRHESVSSRYRQKVEIAVNMGGNPTSSGHSRRTVQYGDAVVELLSQYGVKPSLEKPVGDVRSGA